MNTSLLQRLFDYRAWAHRGLMAAMAQVDIGRHASEREAALRLLDHVNRVDQVFAAHLCGGTHGLATTSSMTAPPLDELAQRIDTSDHWYAQFVRSASSESLGERVFFVFTDRDRGCMSREEMLLHVLTHSGYHRGEAGRILASTGVALPWDTFAVHLHGTEPSRRTEAITPSA